MIRHFRRKFGTQEHIHRHHHKGGIISRCKDLANVALRIGRQVFLPAEHALLFASYRKHQSRRMQAVDIDSISHLHRVKPAQAHAATLSHSIAENEFRFFHLNFTGEFKFVLRCIQNRLGYAQRIIPIKAHFLFDFVLHFDAFCNLERDSLFAELR